MGSSSADTCVSVDHGCIGYLWVILIKRQRPSTQDSPMMAIREMVHLYRGREMVSGSVRIMVVLASELNSEMHRTLGVGDLFVRRIISFPHHLLELVTGAFQPPTHPLHGTANIVADRILANPLDFHPASLRVGKCSVC